jgi:MFS family permease
MAMQFLMPTLPLYMKSLGGQDSDVGLIFGVFSLSALASRFVAGPLVDLWGRKLPLLIGVVLFLAAMLLYSFANTVSSLVLLRLFHGIGFGIVGTASSALAADLAPPRRRGEALGWYGNFASISLAISPGIALWLISAPGLPISGFPLLFLAGDVVVLLALLFALQVRESRRPTAARPALVAALSPGRIFCRDALPFAFAMLFAAFTFGAFISFVPLYLSTENSGNVPIFFLAYAAVMTASRPVVGRISDRFDRRVVAVPLMLLCAAGVSLFALGPSLPVALAAALVFGVGHGALNPTLLALVVDVVKPQERGSAMGTFMASIDVGIGVGSMVMGVVAQAYGYHQMFLAAGAVGLLGLGYWLLYLRLSSRPRVTVEAPAVRPAPLRSPPPPAHR